MAQTNKWTRGQIVGAILGGLAIAGVLWFCSYSMTEALRQAYDAVNGGN